MNERHIQILSLVIVALGGVLISWIYLAAPKDLAEAGSMAAETLGTVKRRTQVAIGTYAVDEAKFEEGVRAFREERFVAARDLLDRADPERRDARTQFYIAYSFYRQGWGRFASDDELFAAGIEAADRAIALDPDFTSDDRSLGIRTPVELKAELEEGRRITSSDFNPLKVFRERK